MSWNPEFAAPPGERDRAMCKESRQVGTDDSLDVLDLARLEG